ncbi:hypothetical protein PHMEG_00019469 [Phytophthora megakarya]|uniref:Uncharacterized protein n=1 Tax=Phytophthora megakarya TaxID=4795 RepID=A0A225VRU3_9STRA|nr:hypothetical protein PHMEG_00019469 [Phytophthora megakarya]
MLLSSTIETLEVESSPTMVLSRRTLRICLSTLLPMNLLYWKTLLLT